jgi:hypothetical protein
LRQQLADLADQPPPVRLHPNAASVYAAKVAEL